MNTPSKPRQFNVRLPDPTWQAIEYIQKETRMSQSKMAMVSLERLAAEIKARKKKYKRG